MKRIERYLLSSVPRETRISSLPRELRAELAKFMYLREFGRPCNENVFIEQMPFEDDVYELKMKVPSFSEDEPYPLLIWLRFSLLPEIQEIPDYDSILDRAKDLYTFIWRVLRREKRVSFNSYTTRYPFISNETLYYDGGNTIHAMISSFSDVSEYEHEVKIEICYEVLEALLTLADLIRFRATRLLLDELQIDFDLTLPDNLSDLLMRFPIECDITVTYDFEENLGYRISLSTNDETFQFWINLQNLSPLIEFILDALRGRRTSLPILTEISSGNPKEGLLSFAEDLTLTISNSVNKSFPFCLDLLDTLILISLSPI